MRYRQLLFISLPVALALICGCASGGGGQLTGPPSTNVFDGQYAIVLSGFDPAGIHPMGIVGSITGDGLGHITSGSVDMNDNQIISSSNAALAGSYTLDSNFRGVITLTSAVGSVTHPLAFSFTLKADGTSGALMDSDANNFVLSGTIQKQDATAFSLASLAGNFAFEFDSRAPSQRSFLGRFTLGSSGTSTNVVFDVSEAGTGAFGPFSGGPVAVTFASSGPNASGRGTFVVIDGSHNTGNFVYYVVGAGTLVAMEIDPTGGAAQSIFTGLASKQSTPFSATTVNTPASVFALTGFDTPSPNDMVAVGLVQITNSNTASLRWDTDDVGTIFSQTLAGQSVTFDPSTGRGMITVTGGAAIGLFDSAVFYLTDSGNGFLIDATAGVSNRALAGHLQAQTGSGSFGAASFSGNNILRQSGLSLNNNGALVAKVSESVTGNVLTGTAVGDFRNLSGNTALNQSVSLIPANFTIDANTGRGTLIFPSPGNTFTNTNVFYVIGTDHYVLIDETPLPNNAIPIEFHDPQ